MRIKEVITLLINFSLLVTEKINEDKCGQYMLLPGAGAACVMCRAMPKIRQTSARYFILRFWLGILLALIDLK